MLSWFELRVTAAIAAALSAEPMMMFFESYIEKMWE